MLGSSPCCLSSSTPSMLEVAQPAPTLKKMSPGRGAAFRVIINSGGKNMSPVNIESKIKTASLLIGQAVAIGDRRSYNVALIVLDPDASAAYAKEHGLPSAAPDDLCEDHGVQAVVEAAVAQANSQLSRIEQIKKFRILPVDWLPAGDELTPTSKLKRKPIAAKYAQVIDALYAGER